MNELDETKNEVTSLQNIGVWVFFSKVISSHSTLGPKKQT